MKRDDYLLIALVLFMIAFSIEIVTNNYNNKKLVKELQEVKQVAVEINNDNKTYYYMIEVLNEHIDKMNKLDRLVNDLSSIPTEFISITLANCYNESNLNYDVKHKGSYDRTTIGICGVKEEWIGVVDGVNEYNINSLQAGYLVLQHLIKQEGSFEAGLKKYKGSIKNTKPVKKTLYIKEMINF